MWNNNKVRAGIWARVLAIGIGLPIICVWGSPKTGLIIIVIGWIIGVILDADFTNRIETESKKQAAENHERLMEKINKYSKR